MHEHRQPIPPVHPWTERDVRGITTLSIDDVAAMTGTLLAFGLIPTPPGETSPAELIFNTRKETTDGK